MSILKLYLLYRELLYTRWRLIEIVLHLSFCPSNTKHISLEYLEENCEHDLHDDHICEKSHCITQKHQRISLWFEKLDINWVLPATFCWSCWFVTDVRPFSRSFRDTQLRFHPKCRRIGIAHVNRLSSFIFLENLSRFQRHKTSIDVIVSMHSKKWIGDIRCSRIKTGSNPLSIKLLWFGYWETGLQMIHSLRLQLLHFFNLLGFLFFNFYDIIQNLLRFFYIITFNGSQKIKTVYY